VFRPIRRDQTAITGDSALLADQVNPEIRALRDVGERDLPAV
jgi:hypothetical protein